MIEKIGLELELITSTFIMISYLEVFHFSVNLSHILFHAKVNSDRSQLAKVFSRGHYQVKCEFVTEPLSTTLNV
jgi:hypothetical protein